MYLSELRIWNFRKYGIKGDSFDDSEPGVFIPFNKGLNVLIGENDSGKTAIVDAIRYTLGTQSGDWIHIEETDFHKDDGNTAQKFKIECVFSDFTEEEAGQFLEWLETDPSKDNTFTMTVRLTAQRKPGRIIQELRAGADPIGTTLDGEARNLIHATYLKPLRDADAELTPGYRSRFAQILKAHTLFQPKDGEPHDLEKIFQHANKEVSEYFSIQENHDGATDLIEQLASYIREFFPQNETHEPMISISGDSLADILKRLSLFLDTTEQPSGLGAANLLFMAAELLLLQSQESPGLKLALIEELEAHLHPQAQLNLINYLKNKKRQFILTTHSTAIGSSVPLESLLLCQENNVFSMGSDFTCLAPKDYKFLERFLDATKANLFFARGVLFVEGDAENLLLPTLAEAIDRPLHRYGVSIVNVGSIAFLHYARIFQRTQGSQLNTKIAIITDMDIRPEEGCDSENERNEKKENLETSYNNENTKIFVSPHWTLEYEIALATSFRREFYETILWAEKITNSATGEPQESKREEVKRKVKDDFQSWSTLEAEKIAEEIYGKNLIKRHISKAVVAQNFAEFLEERMKKDRRILREELQNEPAIEYLLDAIYYVTAPEGSDD